MEEDESSDELESELLELPELPDLLDSVLAFLLDAVGEASAATDEEV